MTKVALIDCQTEKNKIKRSRLCFPKLAKDLPSTKEFSSQLLFSFIYIVLVISLLTFVKIKTRSKHTQK